MYIPFLNLAIARKKLDAELVDAFKEVLSSNDFILGKNVKEFESRYSEFNNVKHTLGVGNGLDALKIALKTLNIGKGDEVIIPSNTFIATALAVSDVGADVVLCEPKSRTYNIDVDLIESHISSRTKAIIPVHLYGQACEMDAIMDIAVRHDLFVIEDNAQAQGAVHNGKVTGSTGHINATSFYPGKNLGALGDAGAITTNNSGYFEIASKYRNYGSSIKYVHDFQGFNSRLDEIQASFLLVKLNYLKEWNMQRKLIADKYSSELAGIGDIVLPETATGSTHVYHLYVIRTEQRDKLQQYLKDKGIDTLIHYPISIHLQGAYTSLKVKKGAYPIAEKISSTALSLPIYPGLKVEEKDYICDCIRGFYT